MAYRLPCHPSVMTLDPLGIADWPDDGDPPAWSVLSQLLRPEALPRDLATLCELLSNTYYSIHQVQAWHEWHR